MRDDRDSEAWHRSVMASAEVCMLRDGADEVGMLVRELLAKPVIRDTDLSPREVALALMVGKKADAARRLLAILAGDPNNQWL